MRRRHALALLPALTAAVCTASPASACSFAPFPTSVSPTAAGPGETVTVRFDGPRGFGYELRAREAGQPGTETVVSRGVLPVPDGVAWTARSNTRFRLTYAAPPAAPPVAPTGPGTGVVVVDSCADVVVSFDGPSLAVRHEVGPVRAERTGVRSYVFTGQVVPAQAGELVSLYRTAGGRSVLTAQGRTVADGTYRIERTFGRSGRWDVRVQVGADRQHGAGTSPARPTVVH